MKGISKILAVSAFIMKLHAAGTTTPSVPGSSAAPGTGAAPGSAPDAGAAVAVPSCAFNPVQQPAFVMVPTAPSPLMNCGAPFQNPFYPTTPQTPSQQPPTQQPLADPEDSPQPEDIGTCTVTMVKHCDKGDTAPAQSSTTPTAPSSVAPAGPNTPQQAAQPQPPAQPTTPAGPNSPQRPAAPAANVPVTPAAGSPYAPMQAPGQSPFAPVASPAPACQCTSSSVVPPPNPNPVPSLNPMPISGNGYPVNNTYNSNLGQMKPSCADLQTANNSSCEQKPQFLPTPEKIAQYNNEACANPTPTIVIGNHEYLVGPPMYHAINKPQGCTPPPCPCAA